MTRRIFVGDVQGCREELELLLERVRFDPASDVLEPVGDFVNRGPDSLGVLRLCRSLGAGGVLGNHDVHLLRVARGARAARPSDTFGDVLAASDRDELLAWLAARPFVKAWSDVILVHGALHPEWRDPLVELAGLDPLTPDAKSDFATRARYCTADGAVPQRDDPPPRAPFAPWFEHWLATKRDPRTIVFGHWAMLGLVVRPGLRGLDTGCVWGKQLTAWIAEEDRLVQVPARRQHAAFD
jgi:bis(5'-nucleosyl)-tetraphosphatase (symmetrical)